MLIVLNVQIKELNNSVLFIMNPFVKLGLVVRKINVE